MQQIQGKGHAYDNLIVKELIRFLVDEGLSHVIFDALHTGFKDSDYYPRDMHWNRRGHKKAAKAIYRHLTRPEKVGDRSADCGEAM